MPSNNITLKMNNPDTEIPPQLDILDPRKNEEEREKRFQSLDKLISFTRMGECLFPPPMKDFPDYQYDQNTTLKEISSDLYDLASNLGLIINERPDLRLVDIQTSKSDRVFGKVRDFICKVSKVIPEPIGYSSDEQLPNSDPNRNLVFVLEQALLMAKQPTAQTDEVIRYVRGQLENIENPHHALEQELARLVEAKMPPNGEFYKTRKDKSEFAVAFFRRVYGRFYDAKVIYAYQLRAMDFNLYELVLKARDQLPLPTKRDANDKSLMNLPSGIDVVRLANVVTRRQRTAV